jgi:hypothetical protein
MGRCLHAPVPFTMRRFSGRIRGLRGRNLGYSDCMIRRIESHNAAYWIAQICVDPFPSPDFPWSISEDEGEHD